MNEYQKVALSTDIFNGKASDITDIAFMAQILGLVGEAGEVAEKLKKIYRDEHGKLGPGDAAEIVKELGDILWYISTLSHYLGYSLEQVAEANMVKLASRQQRGAIKGAGDNR